MRAWGAPSDRSYDRVIGQGAEHEEVNIVAEGEGEEAG